MSGYSGTPLAKKLGIKENFKILLVNQPDYYFTLFDYLPDGLSEANSKEQVDFIHFFTKDANQLFSNIDKLKGRMKLDGMMWISWPKKSSKVPTTVDEALVRKTGLDSGLVDIKICAVDEVWSGLKFVYRTKDRK